MSMGSLVAPYQVVLVDLAKSVQVGPDILFGKEIQVLDESGFW